MANFSESFINKLFDVAYDVYSDFKESHKQRTCENCGCTYTIDEAASFFADHIDGVSYRVLDGLCGPCAVEEVEANSEILSFDDD